MSTTPGRKVLDGVAFRLEATAIMFAELLCLARVFAVIVVG
jgi:hypothetical protein